MRCNILNIERKFMKNIGLFVLLAITLSACSSNTETPQSTFKNTAACQSQLKDIAKANFKLDDISNESLVFDVQAQASDEEIIQMNIVQKDQNENRSVGRMKVNKATNEMYNSTFDNTNLIAVKLDSHPSFIAECF